MYKKKSLNFTHAKVSRDLRVNNTLKARENSRFKRFSVSRNINDSDSNSLMETPKQDVKVSVPENKAALARIEMLRKWKQEKQIKKEIENQAKKKPFYVGGNKNVFPKQNLENLKSSVAQSNISFNTSKLVKSKFATPAATVQSSRIQSSKQGSSNSTQTLRVPNSKQKTPIAVQPLKVQNSKQGVSSSIQVSKIPSTKQGALAFQSSKIPNYKQTTSLPKSGTTNLGKTPISASTAKVNVPKSGSSAAAVRKFQAPTSTINKAGKGLPKPSPNLTAVSKGIPVQSKMPVSSMNKKFEWNLKLPQKDVSQSENSSLRKGYSFKNFAKSTNKQTVVSKTPLQMTPAKLKGKTTTKDVKEKSPIKRLEEQTLDNIPDVTFNSDISIIKPAESFAPSNFSFRPPVELEQFEFDDDVYKSLEELELKFMSRTSTPSKSSERKSNYKNSPVECNKSIPEEKMTDVSNSNDIGISELMTPGSFKAKPDNKEMYEVENKHVDNEKNCDTITNIKFKEADVAAIEEVNEKVLFNSPVKTEVKNVDTAINCHVPAELVSNSTATTETKPHTDISQQTNEELVPISPTKTEVKDVDCAVNNHASVDLVSGSTAVTETETHIDTNQQAHEELVSFSPTKTEVKDVDCAVNNHASIDLVSGSIAVTEAEAHIDTNQQAHKELVSFSPRKTFVNVEDNIITETDSCVNTNEPRCENLVSISPAKNLVKDAIKNKNSHACEEITFNNSRSEKKDIGVKDEIITNENKCNYFLKNMASKDAREKNAFLNINDDEELLDSIDLNKINLVNNDDSDEDDVLLPEISKFSERKSNGAIPKKRVSMLKKLSVMNSISETVEANDSFSENSPKSAKDNLNIKNTPRRSKRISDRCFPDMFNDLNLENCNSPNKALTPRRSLRLMKITTANDQNTMSPLQSKKNNQGKQRQSIRLIDLGTPEKAVSEKLLKDDCENLDTNNLLMDLESPSKPSLLKSRKVSLLYSPDKRKSLRKSIRGDLMAFSPM